MKAVANQPWIPVNEIPGLSVPYFAAEAADAAVEAAAAAEASGDGDRKVKDVDGVDFGFGAGVDLESDSNFGSTSTGAVELTPPNARGPASHRLDTSILRDDVQIAKAQIRRHARSVVDALPEWMFCTAARDGGTAEGDEDEEYGNHNVADARALEEAVAKLAADEALNSEVSGTGILRDIAADYARLVRASVHQLDDEYERARSAVRDAVASMRRDQYAALVHAGGECARVHARFRVADRQLGRRQTEYEAQYREPLRQALLVWREYADGIRTAMVDSARSILKPIFGTQSDLAAERARDLQEALESGARFVGTLTGESCTLDLILDHHLPQLEGVLNILREKAHKLVHLAGAPAAQHAARATSAGVSAAEVERLLSLDETSLQEELHRKEDQVRKAYEAAYAPGGGHEGEGAPGAALRLAETADAELAFARGIHSSRAVLQADRPGVMAARQVINMLQDVRALSAKVRDRLDVIRARVREEGLPLRTARREAWGVAEDFIRRQRDGVRSVLDARATRVVEDVRRLANDFVERAEASLDATVSKAERLLRHVDEVCLRVHMHRGWGEITAGAAALKARVMRVAGLWVSSIRSCVRALLRDVRDSALEQAQAVRREAEETERNAAALLRPPPAASPEGGDPAGAAGEGRGSAAALWLG